MVKNRPVVTPHTTVASPPMARMKQKTSKTIVLNHNARASLVKIIRGHPDRGHKAEIGFEHAIASPSRSLRCPLRVPLFGLHEATAKVGFLTHTL